MYTKTESATPKKTIELPYNIGSYFVGEEKNLMLVSLLGTAQAALTTTIPIDSKTADGIAFVLGLAISMIEDGEDGVEA